MKKFYHYPDHRNTYRPAGYERTPHLPLEGQPVVLTAAVEGASGDVMLKSTVDGQPCADIIGNETHAEGEKRFFSFEMGSFPYSSKVEYCFEADGDASRTFGFTVCRETNIDKFSNVSEVNGCLCLGIPWQGRLFVACQGGRLVISSDACEGQGTFGCSGRKYVYEDCGSPSRIEVLPEQGQLDIYGQDGSIALRGLQLIVCHTADSLIGFAMTYRTGCSAVYGLGERFDNVNHIGQCMDAMVFEQFTNQNRATYFPIPFYYTNNGHGIYLDTLCRSEYDFGSVECGQFRVGARIGTSGQMPDIHLFFGKPKTILEAFTRLCGRPAMPPKWAFGLWISANRWNCQKHIEEQLVEIEAYHYPATALVIEAWSDEATFYIWNDAQYELKGGGQNHLISDFQFPSSGRWPDPAAMIRKLHERDIRLVLWQIPVLKKLGQKEPTNHQHENDLRYVLEHGFCVGDGKGEAYTIPDFWFCGSYIPDFTNTLARDWWFGKREYLLSMGVDGFKTDGGEFIHDDHCAFNDGSTGVEMKNGFAASYLEAYSDFIGRERILFSRAGYTCSQRNPMHWAGDQESTWKELRSVLKAGLTLGMSGVPFWSFDIGGFAGPLPSAELYIRSTELAAFAPVMQWHSEPMGGQFAGTHCKDVNDRSPWNIARTTGDPKVLDCSLFYASLRQSLLPQLYSEAQKSTASGLPMMRHLAMEYPDDSCVASISDQFMLGDLLVAPVVEEGMASREVYLPTGIWMDVWTGNHIKGGGYIQAEAPIGHIPLYLRHGGALALATECCLLEDKNKREFSPGLCILTAGEMGQQSIIGFDGKVWEFNWSNGLLI